MRLAALLLCSVNLAAHAPVLPPIEGPLETRGNLLIDTGNGQAVSLRGVTVAQPGAVTFGLIRVRWNMNSARLPVSIATWRQERERYLDRIAADVRAANDAELLAVLAANEAGADAAAFWSAIGARFKDNPRLVFSLFQEPGPRAWRAWRERMQPVIDAIRATGARQVIAAAAFPDALGFQGLGAEDLLLGANIIYEARGTMDAVFAPVIGRAPAYAAGWDSGDAGEESVIGALSDLDRLQVSWTVNGVSEAILLWTTGDPGGFGFLRPDFIANSAGGFAGPIAPGELLSLYVEQLGPAAGAQARLGSDGKLPVNLEGTEVLFDGVPAPLLFAGAFQINVQVPYELRPGSKTAIQVFFRGIPSNRIDMDVAESAPEVFHDFATRYALALNEDGSRNGPSRPSRPGGIIVLFASGGGQTSPAGSTGLPAPSPHPRLTRSAGVTIGGSEAEILFAGEVPGNVGLVQVNARLSASFGGALRPVPVVLRIGGRSSQAPVLIWLAQ